MKNIFLTIAILFASWASAQVAIGKTELSKLADNLTPNPSISLEFGNENRGLILPWVDSEAAVTGVVNGTIVFDAAASEKKVKVKYAAGWKDLSINSGSTIDPISSVDALAIQNSKTELPNAKVSIGNPSATPGILVLEDDNKAMILPKVASPHLNIINPAPGMIVYDTISKQLAVFNGAVWTFWKP